MKTIVRKTKTKQIETISVNNDYLKDKNCVGFLGNTFFELTSREIGTNVIVEALDTNVGSIQSENFAVTIIKTKDTTVFNILSVRFVYLLINDQQA